MTRSFRVLANQKAQITCKFEVICEVIQGRKKQVKVGGLWLSGALFHKKGHLQVNSFMVAIQCNCF